MESLLIACQPRLVMIGHLFNECFTVYLLGCKLVFYAEHVFQLLA